MTTAKETWNIEDEEVERTIEVLNLNYQFKGIGSLSPRLKERKYGREGITITLLYSTPYFTDGKLTAFGTEETMNELELLLTKHKLVLVATK